MWMQHQRWSLRLGLATLSVFVAWSALPSSASAAYAPQLKRYPYLTDVVGSSATVDWGTDRSQATATVKWGPVGGSCTTNTATATRTSITVNSVNQYQWSAPLSVTPNTEYCYRVYLGSSPQVDLLGTDASPRFFSQLPAGSSQSFSFAVIGDWGEVVNSNGTNPALANVMQGIASSGVRFALTVGDNAYPSGSQTNYGDLVQTGANISAIFGPSFWTVPGKSIPMFPATGNHGMSTGDVHLLNWPQSQAVSSSNGRYVFENYCCLNGTNPVDYPSAWYAFNAGNSRFYVLTASWGNSNVGTADLYENDYDNHWTPTSPEYQWLQNDLATNASQHKFAFFHFPIYSDQKDEDSDTWLQSATPPQQPSSLEGLLSAYGVDMAFSGHAHLYQRNLKPHANSLPTYITGGGGADIQSIGQAGCSSFDAYGIGWSDSSNQGNKCGSAPVPTSRAQVNHFLKVTVNGSQVTVAPTNSLGQTFDVTTYGSPSPVADLSLTKSDSPDPVLRGQLLTYTVTATNNGPSSATGVTLTDDFPANATYDSATATQGSCTQSGTRVTCNLGSLASGNSATATIKVRPQAEGSIINTANVQASQSDPVSANNSASAATTVNPTADLSLTKTDSPDPVLRGQLLTYTVTATNNGPSSATGVTLTDDFPANATYDSATATQGSCTQSGTRVTCNLGSLASGNSATATIKVRPQAEGSITNNANVQATQPDLNSANNSASASTTVSPAADLALTKTDSPDPVLRDQPLTYTLTATNNGPSSASGVTLTDDLSSLVLYNSAASSQGTCSHSGGTPQGGQVTCNLGTLASGATATVNITVLPKAEGSITNNASVQASQSDPNSANNSSSASTTVSPAANLSLAKSDSPDPVLRGQLLTYTVTVGNLGPSSATGVTLIDALPGSATYDSATATQGTCSHSSGQVTCNLGTLTSGGTATATIRVRPQTEGVITNSASVQASETDPVSANNSAAQATTVNPTADLSLTKSDSPDPVLAGQLLTYTLTATNNGPSGATGVTVTDTLPAGVNFDSATASQGSCSQSGGTVTCNLGAIANGGAATATVRVRPQSTGTITNTASVSAAEPDTNSQNNQATEQTTGDPAADLSLAKLDSPDPVPAGQLLTYTLTAANNGPSGATGVTITDALPAGVSFDSATATQGTCGEASGTVTCSLGTLANGGAATATVKVRPQSTGTITNTASIQGNEPDPASANNSASQATTVDPTADLSLTKSDSPDPVLRGQALTYTLTATNDGPSGATGVTVTDTLPGGVSFEGATASQGDCAEAGATVTCSLGSLASGATVIVNIQVRPEIEGVITNTAGVSATEPDADSQNNQATEQSTVDPVADLSIAKTDSPDPVLAGQTLTYTLIATNNGPSSAGEVELFDTLPAEVSFQSASASQGSCTHASGAVTCGLGTLASGATATATIQVTPESEGVITNTASVIGGQADPDSQNNQATEQTTVDPGANLSLTKADSPDPVRASELLTYTLTATNNGPSNASGAVITDTLSAGVGFESASASQGVCLFSVDTVSCFLGALDSGATATATIAVRPQAEGTVTNTASVESSVADPDAQDNQATEQTIVAGLDAPYPRPTGGATFRTSLVPAFRECTEPDSLHAGALTVKGSCTNPQQGSSTATVGGSAEAGTRLGYASVDVCTAPQPPSGICSASVMGPAPDVRLRGNSSDIVCKTDADARACPGGAGSDYDPDASPGPYASNLDSGTDSNAQVPQAICNPIPPNPSNCSAGADMTGLAGLPGSTSSAGKTMRITDSFNDLPSAGDPPDCATTTSCSATVRDQGFGIPIACSATSSSSVGSYCGVNTTANALVPGLVEGGKAAVVEIGQLQVFDSGPDGVRSNADDELLAVQGIFIP